MNFLVDKSKEYSKPFKKVESAWNISKKIADKQHPQKDSNYYIKATTILDNLLSLSLESKPKRTVKTVTKNRKLPSIKKLTKVRKKSVPKVKKVVTEPAVLDNTPINKVRPVDILNEDKKDIILVKPLQQPLLENLDKPNVALKKQLIKLVNLGMIKLTHILAEKPLIFANGFSALTKLKREESLHNIEKQYLKDMVDLVFSVVLVSIEAYRELLNYNSEVASLYITTLGKPVKINKLIKERKQSLKEPTQVQPSVVDELDLDLNQRDKQHLQHLANHILDWLLIQDYEDILRKVKRISNYD